MNKTFTSFVKLTVFAVLLSLPAFAYADKEAWVEWQESTKTLTFRYDDQKDSTEATGKYDILPTMQNTPEWSSSRNGISKDVEKVVFDKSFADARPECCYLWFSRMGDLKTIEGIENLNTSAVKYMSSMFWECSSLTSIDLSHFDTSNVENMLSMFSGCTSLTSIDLSSFKTDNLKTMSNLFYNCTKLEKVTLPALDNPKLTCTDLMFSGCSSLKEINLSKFKTPSVEEMYAMFDGCSNLTSVDLSSFETSKVKFMTGMFANCTKLEDVILTSFDTSSVTTTSAMFSGCSSLRYLYVGDKFALSDSCVSENMFSGCVSLPNFDSSKVDKSMANTTNGYLTKIVTGSQAWVEYDETSKTLTFHYDDQYTGSDNQYEIPQDMTTTPEWYEHRTDIEKVVFDQAFSYARPTCCYGWFVDLQKLTTIEGIENLNTSKVEDMSWMFYGCESLTTLDLRHFNTSNVTCMDNMFYECSSLSTIYVGKSFVLSEECTGNIMFWGCSNLKGFDSQNIGKEMANYDTGYFSKYPGPTEPWAEYDATTNTLTFYYNGEREYSDATMTCLYNLAADLDSFEYPGWFGYAGEITKVVFDKSFADYRPQSCNGLFEDMVQLADIEGIENLNTSEVKNMSAMFGNCGIQSLDLSSFNTSSVENMKYMFECCFNLETVDMSNWDTSKVKDMKDMFGYCDCLTSVDISHFNMSAAENLYGMFEYCYSLESVRMPQSRTPKVYSTSQMFRCCEELEELDLSWFTTDTLGAATQMFANCSALKNIYVNDKFELYKNWSGNRMFEGCTLLPNYDASNCGEAKANYTDGCLSLRRHFTVGAKSYNADGVDAVCYDNVNFGDKDAFSSDFDFTFDIANTASYSREVSSNWATLCLPFSFDVASNKGVTCYRISEVGTDKITVEQIQESVTAGEPILVYTATGNISICSNAGAEVVKEPVTSNYLVGTFDEKEVANAANNYIISNNKFWNVASLLSDSSAMGVKALPYRAYITTPVGESKSISLDIITDETNGISDINADDTLYLLNGSDLYDLQGRRLNSPAKGMMIVKKGGITKKVFVN